MRSAAVDRRSVRAFARCAAEEPTLAGLITETYAVKGGLCVQLGGEGRSLVGDLARTGKYLVQVLTWNPDTITRARDHVQTLGCYGIVAVDGLPAPATLPFAENLVNVLVLEEQSTPPMPLAVGSCTFPRSVPAVGAMRFALVDADAFGIWFLFVCVWICFTREAVGWAECTAFATFRSRRRPCYRVP